MEVNAREKGNGWQELKGGEKRKYFNLVRDAELKKGKDCNGV